MQENWVVVNQKGNFEKLKSEISLSPLITRLLSNRNITTKKDAYMFLNGTIDDLYDSRLMKDMVRGVNIIKEAIETKKRIIIYGDYDCDGVCSTTIFCKVLKFLNANFKYYIPSREDEGYGMNSNRIKILKDEGAEYILTCDNGISAINEVKYAKELGLTVVVTDHHEVPYEEIDGEKIYKVPEADCVIDPKQKDCDYPFKELCGAGVALKFSKLLLESFNVTYTSFNELYELATLATICDVVELMDENRIIVKKGLSTMGNTENIGLRELIKETKLVDSKIGEYHLGFVLGPCINATGRLETADLSVELLITEDEENAKSLAKTLHRLNSDRQELTKDSLEKVYEKIENDFSENDKVILVYDGSIHESIAGIVAGRVRERYNLPTIIMTDTKEEGLAKGSGRSIECYHMYEELNKCKDLIEKFGGHPMAAGLTVKKENLLALRQELNKKCMLTEEQIIPTIKIDTPLKFSLINENIINEIEELRPFGKGNPSPLFAVKNISVDKVFFMGKDKQFLKFLMKQDNISLQGLNFNKYEEFKEAYTEKFGKEAFLDLLDTGYCNMKMDIIYYPQVNEFNGKKSVQLNIKNFRII